MQQITNQNWCDLIEWGKSLELIETLDLNTDTYNTLKRDGITIVEDALEGLDYLPDNGLLRNISKQSLDELVVRLKEKGYLAGSYEPPKRGDSDTK